MTSPARTTKLSALLVTASALGVIACDDFATPAELETTQILAVRTEPPAIDRGGESALEILVAGPEGQVAAPDVMWEAVAPFPDTPVVGRIAVGGDGTVTYIAPETIDENPTIASVEARVDDGERVLRAVKVVVVGSVTLANPGIASVRVDDADVTGDAEIVVPSGGEAVELAVAIEPKADDDTLYAWYSTVGEIEKFQSSPTELVTPLDPEEGWLFVVVRDGTGGVTWHKSRIRAE